MQPCDLGTQTGFSLAAFRESFSCTEGLLTEFLTWNVHENISYLSMGPLRDVA